MTWLMTAEGETMARERLAGTDQQEAFWAAVLDDGEGNLLLSARAGTGKSASCREAMWRLIEDKGRTPPPIVRYCCFNKAIADEFRLKCPPGVEVGTMHGLGFRACARAYGSKLEKQKTYLILDQIGAGLLPRRRRKAISKLVSIAKNRAFGPAGDDAAKAVQLPHMLDLIAGYLDGLDPREHEAVARWAMDVLVESARMTAVIDFDDMLWLPAAHDLTFPGCDLLFVDECQDLNPVQHALMPQLMAGGRAIVVGDPFQAIYGFRGADCDSVANLRRRLRAEELPLTKTFRCPTSHVALARELVPDFEAADSNPAGSIGDAPLSELLDVADAGDLVLCRSNAPLVGACLRALAARVPAAMRGRAIGEGLVDLVESVGGATPAELVRNARAWEARQVAALEAREAADDDIEAVMDRVACIESIAGECDTVDAVSRAIRSLFDDRDARGRITFSSVHRAKGSEARRVHFIDVPHGKPGEPLGGQRRNLRHVALTRSLGHLTFIDPDS